MAVLGGTGVVPGSTTATFTELTALTRRAFIPRVTVQIYFSAPTFMLLLGNAQKSAGGMNQITGPVQGQSMVQGAWTGYSGTFNKPQVIPGVNTFAFNTAYFVVPVPLVLGESLLQSTEAIVPILDVRMNDVYAVTAYLLNRNGIITSEDVMDARTLPAVRMPNRDGFVADPRPDVGPRKTKGGR